MACSFAHESVFSPSLARIRVVKLEHLGVDVPVVCRVCARPACVAACPTGALRRDDELVRIMVDASRCTGCNLCVEACPFGAMEMHLEKKIPLVCDLCDGRPQCVRRCATGGVRYRRPGSQGTAKREAVAMAEAEDLRRRWESVPRPYQRDIRPES